MDSPEAHAVSRSSYENPEAHAVPSIRVQKHKISWACSIVWLHWEKIAIPYNKYHRGTSTMQFYNQGIITNFPKNTTSIHQNIMITNLHKHQSWLNTDTWMTLHTIFCNLGAWLWLCASNIIIMKCANRYHWCPCFELCRWHPLLHSQCWLQSVGWYGPSLARAQKNTCMHPCSNLKYLWLCKG